MKKSYTYSQLFVTKKQPLVRLPLPVMMAISLVLTMALLCLVLTHAGGNSSTTQVNAGIMDKFDRFVTNNIMVELSDHVGTEIERTYWLSDSDMVAPEPDQSAFGEATDPAELRDVLDAAAKLLDGQKTLFTTETPIMKGSTIHYYLDETIFAVTWKQAIHSCVYTFSEVKIAHASQFRRFLSEGQYGSGVLHTTTEMAASVNAVVASAGDYYGYRPNGITINNGNIYRSSGLGFLDTCFINEEGDLLFRKKGELANEEALAQFTEENNIRFSLCFGPLMLLDGEYCAPSHYALGQIEDNYARAALCQMDKLHYVLVSTNMEEPYYSVPNISTFAKALRDQGIPTAYTLDGGQTATIVMNDQLINKVSYGSEREISDIIYFATAMPDK